MLKNTANSTCSSTTTVSTIATTSSSTSSNPLTSKRQIFLNIVQESNFACTNGDFLSAIKLYSKALKLDPINPILYSNRSAAYVKCCQFSKAEKDAIKAKELDPKWSKAYYREGVALQCQGKYVEALDAFSSGLAVDPKSSQLLNGLIETAMKSPLQGKLESIFNQIDDLKLSKCAFVNMSLIGQELLASGHFNNSRNILENALRVGTTNLKLKGSVLSALSSAYWALNSMEKAIFSMEKDLEVSKEIGDSIGEIRAHRNLGSAYLKIGNFKSSLTSYRHQLALAMKFKDTVSATSALTSLGIVYTRMKDYENALASHQQSLQLLKSLKINKLCECRELSYIGNIYMLIGEYNKSIYYNNEYLNLSKEINNKLEICRAYLNLGINHEKLKNYKYSMDNYQKTIDIGLELDNNIITSNAYEGLGNIYRHLNEFQIAKTYYEKQLEIHLTSKNKQGECNSLKNLGCIYQLLGDFESSLKLFQASLSISIHLNDQYNMCKNYGFIGSIYSDLGLNEDSIKYYHEQLNLSKELNDKNIEIKTIGNLGIKYQSIGENVQALYYYKKHLKLAKELGDLTHEVCAVINLGNYYCNLERYLDAIPFYECYLMLSQELSDLEGEGKACYHLGYIYYALAQYPEAIRYYNQDLIIQKELVSSNKITNKNSLAKAYYNLGLAYTTVFNYEEALTHQTAYLSLIQELNSNDKDYFQCKWKVLGNIGSILIKLNRIDDALQIFNQQLIIAKSSNIKSMEASTYSNFGIAYRSLKDFDRALTFHLQEYKLYREIQDIDGECKANGNLGAIYIIIGNNESAIQCYEKMLKLSKSLNNMTIEAQANGNLGIIYMNSRNYEKAIYYFKSQMYLLENSQKLNSSSTIEQTSSSILTNLSNVSTVSSSSKTLYEKGCTLKSIGDCYGAKGQIHESLFYFEKAFDLFNQLSNLKEKWKCGKSIGHCYRNLGKHKEALKIFKARLDEETSIKALNSDTNHASSELEDDETGERIGDVAEEQIQLHQYEEALTNLQLRLEILRGKDQLKSIELNTLKSIGKCYERLNLSQDALHHYELALKIGFELAIDEYNEELYLSIGNVFEGLKNYKESLKFYQEFLQIVTTKKFQKGIAFSRIGRSYYHLANWEESKSYLNDGLALINEGVSSKLNVEYIRIGLHEKFSIHHYIGLLHWKDENLNEAYINLTASLTTIDELKREDSYEYFDEKYFKIELINYETLENIAVQLGRTEDALLLAEKGRSMSFPSFCNTIKPHVQCFENIEQLFSRINQFYTSAFLYFSQISTNYLFTWLIIPGLGIFKFNEVMLNTATSKLSDDNSETRMKSLLETYIQNVEEIFATLNSDEDEDFLFGIEDDVETEEFDADTKVNGFLRNRNHKINSSSYSLSSLKSVTGSTHSLIQSNSTEQLNNIGNGSVRKYSRRKLNNSQTSTYPSGLRNLYQLLISPFEDELNTLESLGFDELILVLDRPLTRVPFQLLRSSKDDDYLIEKFKLVITPNISMLENCSNSMLQYNRNILIQHHDHLSQNQYYLSNPTKFPNIIFPPNYIVIGSPKLPEFVKNEMNRTCEMRSEREAILISHVLKVEPYMGSKTSKFNLFSVLSKATIIHFTTINTAGNAFRITTGSSNAMDPTAQSFTMDDHILTLSDIRRIQFRAQLVVLSCCEGRNKNTSANTCNYYGDVMINLIGTLLNNGVQSILTTLWPTTESSSRLFYETFYTCLLEGATISHSLLEGITTLKQSNIFNHPINWACWVLIGSNSVIQPTNYISPNSIIWDLVKTPEKSRNALRVCLHLIEKSLQRINNGQNNGMYTAQKSIENKAGNVEGWQQILQGVGFRFESSINGIPPAVFFPIIDSVGRLSKCSKTLQSILGLPSSLLRSLIKIILTRPDASEQILPILRESILGLIGNKGNKTKIYINIELWGCVGCHELFASLGFDLIEMSENQVTLGLGSKVTLRILQHLLEAILSFLDTLKSSNEKMVEGISLESLELKGDDEELYKNNEGLLRSDLVNGAFVSYVKSCGETNRNRNSTEKDSSSSISSTDRNMGQFSTKRIHRVDSLQSSESSITMNWDNNKEITTIRRKINNNNNCMNQNEYLLNKNINWGRSNTNNTEEQSCSSLNNLSSFTTSELYEQDGSSMLDLAPPLSKLLIKNHINLDEHVEKDELLNLNENKIINETCHRKKIHERKLDEQVRCNGSSDLDLDTGNTSMDEKLSNFDQLSLAEESSGECKVAISSKVQTYKKVGNAKSRLKLRSRSSSKFHSSSSLTNPVEPPKNLVDYEETELKPPIPAKRNFKISSNKNEAKIKQSIQKLFQKRNSSNYSFSNDTKNEPLSTGLTKKDKGDDRNNITDSSCGSYSPSHALDAATSITKSIQNGKQDTSSIEYQKVQLAKSNSNSFDLLNNQYFI